MTDITAPGSGGAIIAVLMMIAFVVLVFGVLPWLMHQAYTVFERLSYRRYRRRLAKWSLKWQKDNGYRQ